MKTKIISLLALVSFSVSAYSVNLVSHYQFDNNLTDSVGSFNLSNVTGGGRDNVTFNSSISLAGGNITNAVVFNGNNYVRSGNTSQFQNGNFTIAFWARPDNNAQEAPLVIHTNNDNNTEMIFMSGRDLRVYNENNGTELLENRVQNAYTEGNWLHIGWTYDATTLTSTLFINGNTVTDTHNNGLAAGAQIAGQLILGRRADTTSPINAYSGLLADLQIYDGVLTQSEINTIYTSGAVIPEPATVALIFGGIALAVVGWRRRR